MAPFLRAGGAGGGTGGLTQAQMQEAVRQGVNQAAGDSTGSGASSSFNIGDLGPGLEGLEDMQDSHDQLKQQRNDMAASGSQMAAEWTTIAVPSPGSTSSMSFNLPVLGNVTLDWSQYSSHIHGFRQLLLACMCVGFMWVNIKAIRFFLT